jgi:phosphoglycerate dehydrogenase-like enzyme
MNDNNPLLKLNNVVLTPHSAWLTKESFDNLAEMVVENVEAFSLGNPKNLVTS